MLERFYAELKNKHGEDYEPESLKVLITSLDRHLKNKGYSVSTIVRDRDFSSSKQVLDGKAKQLRLAGWQDGRVVRVLDFNAVTRVQIPLWPLTGVVPGKCLVHLLGNPCK